MPEDAPISPSPEFTVGGRRIVTVQRWSRRSSVRARVFLLCAVMTVLAYFVRSRIVLLLWELDLLATCTFVAWPFLQAPYLLLTRRSFSTKAGYAVADASILDELPQYRQADLQRLGFSFAGCLARPPDNPQVRTKLAIFIHVENSDSAQLARIQGPLQTREILIFNTRFDDGMVLETSNGTSKGLFRPKPKFKTFRFPQVRNAADLYLVHQRIKKELTRPRQPRLVDPLGALADFISAAEEIHQLNMNQGDFRLNPTRDRYVLTLKGAMRWGFLRTWPISFIRYMLLERDAIRIGKELGFSIDPKFGRATPVNPERP